MKNTITLEEMLAEVQEIEKLTREEQVVTNMIWGVTAEVAEAAKSGKVTILSDYDADGICSAYIMEHTLKALNPDCDVTVEINDRRGSYGLSPEYQGNADRRYIVCDMGSNQLSLARERLGENVIIIDHHLIESEDVRRAFDNQHRDCYNAEKPYAFLSENNKCLCNPHAVHENDSENAQYCATGLTYRIYETAIAMENSKVMSHGLKVHHDEKLDNTMLAMACIGTATDMVSVIDPNSQNREILIKGCAVIDKASPENFDFVIGNILEKCNINDRVTAHRLAFNVGAFLNCAGRMSEITNSNGAQEMYNTIVGDASHSSTYRSIDKFLDLNKERKAYINEITAREDYKKFVTEHTTGASLQDNIGVFILPDNTPSAFAGLVASKLTEVTDKAIVCLTYKGDKGVYTGSGRNASSNKTSLKEFLDNAVAAYNKDNTDTLNIAYGGHEDAIGISSLDNADKLMKAIDAYKENMKAREPSENLMLDISIEKLNAPETLELLKGLEPTGTGLQLPCVEIKGNETYRDKMFKSGRSDWKSIRITNPDTKERVDIADWSYSPEKYPQSGKRNNEIALVASVGLSDYKGLHIELTAKTDRAFLQQRLEELEADKEQETEMCK